MLEDRALEALQRRARLDAELVDEGATGLAEDGQRFGLPTGPVERRHQTRHQTFPQRMLGNAGPQLRDELTVAPQREVGLDPELERRETDLLESGDRGLREARVRQVGQGRASPERQRVVQPLRGPANSPLARSPRAWSTSHSKRPRSSWSGLEPDQVAGRPGHQHVLGQRLAETRDVDAQLRGRVAVRRVCAP